jgi:hypothetical protein
MGQYYMPTVLKKNWKAAKNPVEYSIDSWSFNSGLKLTEHSWCGNTFVGAICWLLANEFYGRPFAWIGDYADAKATKTGTHYLYEMASNIADSKKVKDFVLAITREYGRDIPQYAYAINFTKKEYVKIPKHNKREWRTHPLPLLCCDGNGQGGGDYVVKRDNYDWQKDKRIGSWAYDCIGVTNSKNAIKGMKEIDGYFIPDI